MLGEKKCLKIALLGPPIVTFEDQVQTIKRKQTRSVLYFLACQKEPVSREFLISKFWPNLPEQEARKNLREILSNLRSHFGKADVIITRYDQVSLNPENTEVDVIRFQNMIDRTHFSLFAMPNGKLPDSLYREIREGILLWRTPLFMDGFIQNLSEVESWIQETGNALQAWKQALIERIIDHNISTGNLNEALYWLSIALKADPLKTDLHYLMLTCLRDSGRISEVLNYRDTLERVFKGTYGMEIPSVLVDFIGRVSDSQKQLVTQTNGGDQTLPGNSIPFVGRREVLHQLSNWSITGGIVVLRGESGIGKTRVLQELHNRLNFPFRSLLCVARPMEQNLPLQPFIDGLRQAIKREEWLELDQARADVLRQVFPEIALLSNQERFFHPPLQDALPQIFEAISELLNIAAKQKRLVVFFDNAQWADATSLSLLSFLTNRGMFSGKGFLVLTHRLEERNSSLHQFINRVQAQPDFHSLTLDYLNEVEIKELTYSLLGKMPSAEMVARINRDVGGNPLFLIQTLNLMMDYSTNLDSLSEMQSFPVARESIAFMKERLEGMDRETRMVLDTAAAIGESFTPEVLEDVTQLEPGVLAEIMDNLVGLHVVRVNPAAIPRGEYQFTNARMHQALLAAFSPVRRRMIYKQVVGATEKRYGKTPSLASKYAQYYELAGEVKKAYGQWLLAAIFARERNEKKEAYEAYQRAMTLLEQEEDQFSENEIHDLIASWENYAFDQNDLEICDGLLQKSLDLGKKRFSLLLQGTAHSGIARLMGLKRQPDTAKKHMNLALKDLLAYESDAELMNAYINQGYLYQMEHDFSAAQVSYEKAAELEVKNPDRSSAIARVTVQAILSMLYSQKGEPRKGNELADLGIEGSRHLGFDSASIKARISKCLAQFYLGHYREVIDLSETILPDLETIRMANWAAIFYSVVSASYLCVGYLDRAWSYMQKSREMTSEYTPFGIGSISHGLRGDIFRMLGFLDEAEKEYAYHAKHLEDSFYAIENLYKLGYIKCRKGDVNSGTQLIKEAIEKGKRHGLGMITLPADAMRLVINAEGRNAQEIEEALDAVIQESSDRGFGTLPLSIQFTRLALTPINHEDRHWIDHQQDLVKKAFSLSNIWLELSFHVQIIESQQIPNELRQRSRTRLAAILDTLTENALSDPVKEMIKEFTMGMEQNLGLLN